MKNTKIAAPKNGRKMNKIIFLLILTTLFITSSLFGQNNPNEKLEIYDETIIVTLKNSFGSVNQRHDSNIFTDINIVSIKDLTEITGDVRDKRINHETFRQILAIKLADTDRESILDAVAKVKTLDFVEDAQPNYIRTINLEPNDPYFTSDQLWGMTKIQAPQAWDISMGSQAVRIGIIDTGIRNHPDLDANVTDGWNVHLGDLHNSDDLLNPHGTHVAGTIGGVGNNNLGVVGVNWNVTLVPIRIDIDGTNSYDSIVIAAVIYGINNNIPILNFSFSGFGFNTALRNAIANYFGLFIWSAGNDALNLDYYINPPDSFNLPNIISVGATDVNDERSPFSSYGATSVNIFAPGSDIWSTVFDEGYVSANGTSMAAPHVSGAAALLLSVDPTLTASELKTLLIESGDTITINTPSGQQEVLRLNVNNAINGFSRYDYDLGIGFLSGPSSAGLFTDFSLTTMISNNGLEAANGYTICLKIEGDDTPLATFSGVTLSPNENYVHTFHIEAVNSGYFRYYSEIIWDLDELLTNNQTPFYKVFIHPEFHLLAESFNSGTSLSEIGWGGSLNTSSGIMTDIGMGNSNAMALYVSNESSVQNVYTPVIHNLSHSGEVSFYYKIVSSPQNTPFPIGSNTINIEISTTGPNGPYTPFYTIDNSNHTTSNEFAYLNLPFINSFEEYIHIRFNALRSEGDWGFILDNVIVISSDRPSNWGTPGAGTEDNPYLISNLVNLKWLSEASIDWWIDWDTLVHFKQTANIDATSTLSWNDGAGFKPIGHIDQYPANPFFVGVYDGDGFTIDNLYINIYSYSFASIGLFGNLINNSIIKNLGMNNIFYNGASASNTLSIGGIAAALTNSTISNSYVRGTIIGYALDRPEVGGIVGFMGLMSNLSNCYFQGNINVSFAGGDWWGGIGGISGLTQHGATITYSYSVLHIPTDNPTNSFVGGISGPYGNDASLSHNLWDIETSGVSHATPWGTPPNNYGLTSFEMKKEINYLNAQWDFDDIWDHDLNKNFGYPYLAGLPDVLVSNRPTELNGEQIDETFSLSWEINDINNTGILNGFNIYRNGVVIQHTTTNSYLDTTVDYGGNYEYCVTALYLNPDGESAPSNFINIHIIGDPSFNPPANLVATPGNKVVYLSWESPSSVILRNEKSLPTVLARDEVIQNNPDHRENVRPQSILTQRSGEVASFLAMTENTEIWHSTTDSPLPTPNSRSLSSFIIQRKIEENGNWVQIHQTADNGTISWVNTNLTNGTNYFYRVIAVYNNPDGISEPSEIAGPIVPFGNHPQNLIGTPVIAGAFLTWEEPEAGYSGEIDHYNIYRRLASVGAFEIVHQTPSPDILLWINEGLENNTAYEYYVTAVYEVNGYMVESDPSNQIIVTPLAPAFFSIEPQSHDFGDILVAEISDFQTFTITNIGGTPLTIISIEKTGDDLDDFALSLSDLPWIINPEGSREFVVSFSPASLGEKTAYIEIIDDLGFVVNISEIPRYARNDKILTYRDIHHVSLLGTGIGVPEINIDPSSHDFGDIPVAEISDFFTFTITNAGNADLLINVIFISGEEFAHNITDLPWTINASENATFEVTFTPASEGYKYETLSIYHNAIDSPSFVTLSGTGLFVSNLDDAEIPTITSLIGNYPNPFNPETTIQFSLSTASTLQIEIYSVKGQKVKSLLNEYKTPGIYNIVWKGTDDTGKQVSSGIYFYRMQTEDYVSIKRMILIK